MPKPESDNLLFRYPWLYERIYPDFAAGTAEMCLHVFERFGLKSGDVLDVGCSTGRILATLAENGYGCVGIDLSEQMAEYARSKFPHLDIRTDDMHTFDLGRRFDAVLCLGSTFTYNLDNDDVHAVLANFRRHLRDGGLLILDILNASRFLGSEEFREKVEIRVDEGDFHATAHSRHDLDRRRQCLRRVRTWHIRGEAHPVVDDAEYRLFFPLELECYLSCAGFSVFGMWDNRELNDSELTDRRLFIAARALE